MLSSVVVVSMLVCAVPAEEGPKERTESIALLKKLIPRVNDDRRPGLLFRLAEAYREQARHERQVAMKAYESAHQAWQDAGGRKGSAPDLSAFVGKADALRRNAVSILNRICERHPRYERADDVLFTLGYLHLENKNATKAMSSFSALIRRYPESRHTRQAMLQIGDYYFDQNNLSKSKAAYERVARSKDWSVAGYATYKLAWVDYNLTEYRRGLERLKRIVARDAARSGLGAEALRDMPRFFAGIDATEEAIQYFRGFTDAARLILQLGTLYESQGKLRLSAKVRRYWLANNGLEPRSAEVHQGIVRVLKGLGDERETQAELTKLMKRYGPGSAWSSSVNEDKVGDTHAAIAQMALNYATERHRAAQKSKSDSGYRQAIDLYRTLLENYELEAAEALRTRFYMAEALWTVKAYEAAGVEYDTVGADSSSRFAPEARRAAIYAWEKAKRPWKLVTACDTYVAAARGDDADREKAALKAALIFKEHGKDKEAFKRLSALAKRDLPASVRRRVRRELDTLRMKKLLEGDSRARRLPDGPERVAAVVEAAEGYMDAARTMGHPDLGERALYNAIVLFTDVGRLGRASNLISRFESMFPQSKLRSALGFRKASILERAADLEGAAKAYARFAEQHAKSSSVAVAIHDAAVLFHKAGDHRRAVKYLTRYLAGHARPNEQVHLLEALCGGHEALSEWTKAETCWKRLGRTKGLSADRRLVAELRVSKALEKRGRRRSAVAGYTRLARATPKGPLSRAAIAEASFRALLPKKHRFDQRQRILRKKDLTRLLDEVKGLVAAYETVVTQGEAEWAIASLVCMGEIYQRVATLIRTFPVPAWLTPSQRALYLAELESLAVAPESKALEAYEKAVAKARELEIVGDWADRAWSHVQALRKAPPSGRIRLHPKIVQPMLLAGAQSAQQRKPVE